MRRKGDSFNGVTWYPTRGNGLLTVSGCIEVEGTVAFSEDNVLYDEIHKTDMGTIATTEYITKPECTVLKGWWVY